MALRSYRHLITLVPSERRPRDRPGLPIRACFSLAQGKFKRATDPKACLEDELEEASMSV
jgi:hypothetical protein